MADFLTRQMFSELRFGIYVIAIFSMLRLHVVCVLHWGESGAD